jgi:hypothetical protein
MVGRAVVCGSMLVALAACGGGDDGGGSGGETGEVVELPSSVVCDGQGYDLAPAVGEGTDQAVVYVNGGSGWDYTSWGSLPEEGVASVPEDASIAVCASVTQTGATVSCPFEDEGDKFTLVVSEATYDVTIRAASTGEVLERGTATSEAAECPFSAFWTSGEGTRTDYAEAGADVTAMLEPHLT